MCGNDQGPWACLCWLLSEAFVQNRTAMLLEVLSAPSNPVVWLGSICREQILPIDFWWFLAYSLLTVFTLCSPFISDISWQSHDMSPEVPSGWTLGALLAAAFPKDAGRQNRAATPREPRGRVLISQLCLCFEELQASNCTLMGVLINSNVLQNSNHDL